MADNAGWVTVHDTARTNTKSDSCVVVQIEANLLSWDIPDNKYGDKLSMIPSVSRVQQGKILYHMLVKASVKSRSGIPLAGRNLTIKSSRPHDMVKITNPTDSNGCTTLIF
jgi:hypothetical protein